MLIGIGSNIEPAVNVPRAIATVRQQFDLLAVSTIYTSAPVGRLDQPQFWNGAVLISTMLPAFELKSRLLAIESGLGRVRDPADKCGPRTIDLDLIAFGDSVDPNLAVPDPELAKRWFVAVPAAELWPDWVHPVSGESLKKIADEQVSQIDGSPVEIEASIDVS